MIISPTAISPLNLRLAEEGFTGLLDTYGGAAAAYSVRRLSSAYSGALMEVRRTVSAVTVTADVSFDSNNELSLDSEIIVTGGSSSATNLGEFVAASGYSDPDSLGSGADAFVRTWYDQSGNANDVQQTSASFQPKVVNTGSVILENGVNSISFNNNFLNGGDILKAGSNSLCSFVVGKCTGTNQTFYAKALLGNQASRYSLINAKGTLSLIDNVSNASETVLGSSYFIQKLYNVEYLTNNTHKLYINTVLEGNTTSTTIGDSTYDFEIGGYNTGAGVASNVSPLVGTIQEVIIYLSNESSNRSGIETNINSFYSIY